ncbi:MAG: carboxypeptidase regulatory-like domain-containing protein [Geobacteraceae bacterium]
MKQFFSSFLVLAVASIFFFPQPCPAAVSKGSLEGTVLSAETNQPLPGAALEFQRSYPRKPPVLIRAKSNIEGKFSALLPAGTYRYLVRKSGFGLKEGRAVVTAGKEIALPLPLNREAEIFGRVVNSGGKPLAGLEVSFGSYAHARTDSAGHFTVKTLDVGWYELHLDHSSWVPERQMAFSLAAGERKDAGDVVVRKAGALTVRLVAGNRPVAGAEVSLTGTLAYRYGKTDKKGRVRFTKLPPGSYSLESYDERLTQASNSVDVPEGKSTLVRLMTTFRPPTLSLDDPGRVILPGSVIPISLQGLWVQRAKISIYAIDKARLLDGSIDPGNPATIPVGARKLLREQSVNLVKQRFSFYRRAALKLASLPPGFYLVEAKGNGTVAHSSVLVTRLGLVAKAAPGGTLLFAADLVDGHALEGVEMLEAAVSPGASALPQRLGATANDGLIAVPNRAGSVRYIGHKDDNLAIFHVSAMRAGKESLKGYLYTERPAYRPGQTVYYKGVLRKIVGEGYALPGIKKVSMTVTDSGGQTMLTKEYPVSSAGSFNGEFVLPTQPPLGDYSLQAKAGTQIFETYFKVLEYRKPEFEVTVVAGKKFSVGGDPVPVSLKARYYFGAPVVDGKVSYRIYSRPYYRFEADQDGGTGDEDYGFGGYADFLGEGEAETDSGGKALITIDTQRPDSARVYTVECDVADSAGRQVSATASFTVTPSLIDLSIRPLSYLNSPGKATDIEVTTSTWQGKAVSTPVLVTVDEQVYDQKSRTYSYRKLAERNVATDESGRLVFSQLFPHPGYWRVSGVTTDERGMKATAVGWVWVWREGYAWDTSYRELGVELDKKSYLPGETARIIVKSPAAGTSLLLTVEGREIYSHRVIRSAGSVEVVEIPVSEDMSPYVFVSAVEVDKGHFYSRTRTLRVDSKPELLELKVKTDKVRYEPGEKVRLSVSAQDRNAVPREAELSLAVVDEALFAIAPETRPDIYRFFRGTREHRVLTLNSFPRVYLGGAAKAGMSLQPEDRLQGIKVRKVFKDTAFWLPLLTTGSDGKAEAEFKLPDNLTTWRATVVGFNDRNEFGSGRANFIARLDVMARLQPPRFLTVGDRMNIPGIITNMTDSQRSVSGTFETTGLSLLGESRFSGTVSPGGTLRRDMTVEAKKSGEALLRMRALAGDRGDAMELTIPVFPRGMKRVSQGNIVLRGIEGETVVTLPEKAMGEGAALDLSVAPNLTASLNESLEELIDFPYGCVEQTMSRFLPAVQVKNLLGSTRFVLSAKITEKLERVLDEGLRRLYDFQHEDGGWGWWKEDASDPYLTAHVMYGLALARKAGIPVRSDSFERGVQSLSERLGKGSLAELPALYRAFTLAGRSDEAVEKRIEAGWRQVPPSQRVQYLEALLNRSEKDRAALLLAELKKDLRREGSAVWLQDDDAYSWWYSWRWSGSAVETTALLLESQLAVNPHDPLVSSLAEFLVQKRSGRWWNTTRGTATVVVALAEYAAATGELDASYAARLSLNGRELERYVVDKGRIVQGKSSISLPMKDLQRGDNRLRLERDRSEGALYLSAQLGYFVPPEWADRGAGLSVERKIYRLTPRKNGGEWRMEYLPLQLGDKLAPGDDVEVRLTVDNKEDMNFVIIEDRLPSGFEVRETRTDPRFASYASYWNWYTHQERDDEKMAFFLDVLPAGRHEFRYVMYPELTGEMLALPTAVWPMYVPSLRAESGLWQVGVER